MAQSDLVDEVYIATPHPFHKPCAEIFLNAKKHVLCEKPVCVNVKEAPEFYGAQKIIVCANGKEKCIERPSIGKGFEEEIYESCRCIRTGKTQSDVMPMTESIRILEQMDFIREQINLRYPFDN